MMSRHFRSISILLADLISIVCIFSVVYHLRLDKFPNYNSPDLWLIAATIVLTLFLSGTYEKKKSSYSPHLPVRTFFVCSIAGLICTFWVYLLGPLEFKNYFGRGVLPLSIIIFGLFATYFRFLINKLYILKEESLGLLYLGFSSSAEAFIQELKHHSEIQSISILSPVKQVSSNAKIKFIKDTRTSELLSEQWQGIIIDPKHHSGKLETELLISKRLSGVPVQTLAEYYETHWYMVPINHIEHDWFLRTQGFSMLGDPVSRRVKRLADILISITLLVLSSPLLLIIAPIIKFSSRGPVLFSQTRIGLRGAEFKLFKLRTMICDAEPNGAQWAQTNDPRATKIGNVLRKSRLDEIPQCWNVLRGEMSFVGPRPERPEFTGKLSKKIPYYDLRHVVKPGITGWAQVAFPYGSSVSDAIKKLQYELYYIKNQSLLLDLNIILRTLMIVLKRSGT